MNVFTRSRDGFFVSTDRALLQIDRVHSFLSTEAYWCLGIPKETLAKALAASLCFGLYDRRDDLHATDWVGHKSPSQIGFARVVTDGATFAWICDVYIEATSRGHGLGKWLVEMILEHPDLQGVRRICLATKDAHELYKKFGFKVTETPGNWLEIKNNDIYLRTQTSDSLLPKR